MNENQACEPQGMIPMPTVGYGDCAKESMTRQRLLELTILAKETADVLNAKGLKRHEYCQFGDIVRNMLNLT